MTGSHSHVLGGQYEVPLPAPGVGSVWPQRPELNHSKQPLGLSDRAFLIFSAFLLECVLPLQFSVLSCKMVGREGRLPRAPQTAGLPFPALPPPSPLLHHVALAFPRKPQLDLSSAFPACFSTPCLLSVVLYLVLGHLSKLVMSGQSLSLFEV